MSNRKLPNILETTVETISPEQAEAYLALSSGNRATTQRRVRMLAREMKANKWLLSGEAIKFDKKGKLIDGHHRLIAASENGLTFTTLVIRGLDPTTKLVIDTGKSRTAANILELHGHTLGNVLAACGKRLIQLKTNAGSNVGDVEVTAQEIKAVIERHPKLEESVEFVGTSNNQNVNTHTNRTLLILLHYIGTHLLRMPEKAEAFVEVFKTGVPTYNHDIAHAYREYLIRINKNPKTRITPRLEFANLIRAWNGFVQEKPMRKFQSVGLKDKTKTGRIKVAKHMVIEGLDLDLI